MINADQLVLSPRRPTKSPSDGEAILTSAAANLANWLQAQPGTSFRDLLRHVGGQVLERLEQNLSRKELAKLLNVKDAALRQRISYYRDKGWMTSKKHED